MSIANDGYHPDPEVPPDHPPMNTMGSPAATTLAVCHRRAEERAWESPRPPPYWSVAYLTRCTTKEQKSSYNPLYSQHQTTVRTHLRGQAPAVLVACRAQNTERCLLRPRKVREGGCSA